MEQPTTEKKPYSKPTLTDLGPAICSQPGCTEAATHGYTWQWGEMGTCCLAHRGTLQQLSKNLKRPIEFTMLTNAPEAPMQRSERTALKAQMLVAFEERDEAKQRSAELYQQNVKLAGQVQLLTLQHREAEQQCRDMSHARDRAEAERDAAKRQLADQVEELGRLRMIADATLGPSTPGAMGEAQRRLSADPRPPGWRNSLSEQDEEDEEDEEDETPLSDPTVEE